MMKKICLSAVLLVMFVGGLFAQQRQGDMALIYQRLYKSFLNYAPTDKAIEKILENQQKNGQFQKIDYDNKEFNTGGDKRAHITQMKLMAQAYNNPKCGFYRDKGLYKAFTSALGYWVDANLEDQNWWHRIIGFPKDLMVPLLLMSDDLSKKDKELYDRSLDYLLYSWSIPKQRAQQGANGTDICKFMFVGAVLKNDESLLREIIGKTDSLIRVVSGAREEGIQPDWSFSQHTGSGRQLYLATYGREYIDGVMYFMELVNGTQFAYSPNKTGIVERLFLDGVAWSWYANEMDANQCSRKIVDDNTGPSFVKLTERLYALGTPRKEQIGRMLGMMKGESQLLGNKMYWRHDYMIHRGDGYMATTRMTSTRTVGNEAGNGQGFDNYHTGDGANYIKVKGDEYSPIYAFWNWKRIPGTTVVEDAREMIRPMWGAGGAGGDAFAGGVSDGRNGVCGFIFAKDSLRAHKSWFYFDGYYVGLGAGISTERVDAPVFTTVNQTALSGVVSYGKADAVQGQLIEGGVSAPLSWIWHNGIGYRFAPEQDSVGIRVDAKRGVSVLWLSLGHGVAPKEARYAYAVYPNRAQDEFVKEPEDNYTILSNTRDIQAVMDTKIGKVMALFYKAGTLKLPGAGELHVDEPCALILERMPSGKTRVTLSNPYCESNSLRAIKMSFGTKESLLVLPQNEYSGSGITGEL